MVRILFLLFPIAIFGQFKISHYTSENGLPHDLCYQIIQDKEGYLWLGTDNGLTKFNGHEFTVFNRNNGLSNSFVIDIYEQENKKYIATWGGGCYLFENKTFKPLGNNKDKFSKHQQIISDNNDNIYSIENKCRLNIFDKNDRNNIKLLSLIPISNSLKWIDKEYLSFLRKKNIVPKNQQPFNLQIAKLNNKIYTFTDRFSPQFKGLIALKESKKKLFAFLKNYYIIDIINKKNHFIAVTPNAIIEFNSKKILKTSSLPFNDKTIIHYSENDKFKAYILLDKKTTTNELFIINKQKNNTTLFRNNILKSPVSDIVISNDNTIWVSTYGNGLLQFQENILPLKKNTLKGNYVFDYLELSSNNFFLVTDNIIGTDKKYNFLEKKEFKTASFFSGTNSDTIFAINKKGKKESFSFLNKTILSNLNQQTFFWNNTKIEFGDSKLIYFKNNNQNTADFNLTPEEYNFLRIKKLLVFQNKLCAISNYGLFIINKNFKVEKLYNKKSGFFSDEIINAFIKDNKLYLLQFQNLIIYDGKKIKNNPYTNNNSNFFNDFTITSTNEIWIASQKGLVNFKDENYNLYTKNEGLSSSFYSKIYQNKSKELIALGNNGIDIFKPNLLQALSPLKIMLSSNEKTLLPSSTLLIYPEEEVTLKTDIISFYRSKYLIQYQINNQKWQNLNGATIDLSNYKAGIYQLRIRAKYYFSNWTTTPTYFIEKIPVWYFRWYYYIPILIIGLSLIGFLVFLRIQTLEKRNNRLQNLLDSNEKLQFQLNEMRHNIAQDFHDELGNKLAGISILSDKLLNDEQLKTNKNYPIVERIYNDSQDLFQGIRDFIWAIDSKNGTLEELIFALTDFGENLFEYTSIKFMVMNEVENANFLLPNFWNRQLLLLFKEALTNSYKHSQATQLDLLFSIEDTYLFIECKDNGIGFEPKKLPRQNGLLNLQKRVNKIKSELVIQSNSGTTIIFKGKIG